MLVFLVFLLNGLGSIAASEDSICFRDHAVTETHGDAMLSVFVDSDYGLDCNVSSPKSIQEIATGLYVVQTLNKLNYVPGIKLGLKVHDTCTDTPTVYKNSILNSIENDCKLRFDLGILAPKKYLQKLELLSKLNISPIGSYKDPNLTWSLIEILVGFLSTKYDSIDLLLTSSRHVHNRFLDVSKQAGICVKSDKDLTSGDEQQRNDTEIVIVAIGDYNDVSSWIDEQDDITDDAETIKTWILLTTDYSFVDDLMPEGSYIIKPEQLIVDVDENLNNFNFTETTTNMIVRSPHILGIGKGIVEVIKHFQDFKSRSCTNCGSPSFDMEGRPSLSNSDVFEILDVPIKLQSTRYIVSRKVDGSIYEITAFKIESKKDEFVIVSEKNYSKLPTLCTKKLANNCEDCVNFQDKIDDGKDEDADDDLKTNDEIGIFKSCVWVPIFLTISVCGTLACIGVLVFIVYRYFVEKVLDGNPTLTIGLIIVTIILLQSIIPFCMEDKAIGSLYLNSRKIFYSTLSFGLVFSVMLSRALFLAFSSGVGLITTHINGYLQSFMLFFMAGVEIAISTMYFLMSEDDTSLGSRGFVYMGLLAYDIFLLLALFVSCTFIAQIERNYNEGKCFFGTSIGLLIVWAVWITCFNLSTPESRDFAVSFGIVSTAVLIIIGIFVPRTYFMMAHISIEKQLARRNNSGEFDSRSGINNILAQSRQPFYEYVRSGGGVIESSLPPEINHQHEMQQRSTNECVYGVRKIRSSDRQKVTTGPRRAPIYDNYGFRTEMTELDNGPANNGTAGAYVIPSLQIDNTNNDERTIGAVSFPAKGYSQYAYSPKETRSKSTFSKSPRA